MAKHGEFTPGQHLKGLVPSDLAQCSGAVSFLQSGFWGSFKARFGWNARAFIMDWGLLGTWSLLLIRRHLGPGFSFAYVPWGPEFPPSFPADKRNAALLELASGLRGFLPKDTAFIRFDPPWYGEDVAPSMDKPFVRAGANVQPPDTVLVDLTASEQE
ncbi:MAG: aminoacyltransferase, partial [Treponema sp.]|nr:aminoacyltransferase [Treponema sp.]